MLPLGIVKKVGNNEFLKKYFPFFNNVITISHSVVCMFLCFYFI